jgi:hypothetical protein
MFFHNAGSTDLADFHFRVEGAARRGPLTRCCFRLMAGVCVPGGLAAEMDDQQKRHSAGHVATGA